MNEEEKQEKEYEGIEKARVDVLVLARVVTSELWHFARKMMHVTLARRGVG
jgi:hypothetical protein